MDGLLMLLALLVWLLGLAYVVYGILMAVDAAKNESWGWFVVILLFMFPAAFIYHMVEKPSEDTRYRSRHPRRSSRERDLRDEVDYLRAEVDRLKRG